MHRKRHMVVKLETGECRAVTAEPPLLSSADGPWPGALLEHLRPGLDMEFIDTATCGHVVAVAVGRPATFEWRENGKFRDVRMRAGQAAIFPAQVPMSVRTLCSAEVVSISLDPKFVHCAAHEVFAGATRLELRQCVEVNDPLLHGLAVSMQAEAATGFAGGRAYGETLATTLATHLVARYSDAGPMVRSGTGGLSRHQLRRAVDLIHSGMTEDVLLSELAGAAGLSLFHFARQFKKSTGLSPHQYLIRCRVQRAKELLLSGRHTTSDVATQVGFCDQSHLNTHFKRVFGVTPLEFRRQAGVRRNLG